MRVRTYMALLLAVAGLGGLLYGVDVGIIAGALPYLEATCGLNANQLSVVVAAVLLGSVLSTLFAGLLADWLGRKRLMIASGLLFVASIPLIALARGYGPLVFGRLLQGMSAGLIGVVVPLYLAECLGAANRGKGTGIFQWLLTLGIFMAAAIGFYYSLRVAEVERIGDPAALFAFKDAAWRRIFWVSLPPGFLFVLGSLFLAESPRWLFRHGRREAALAALRRSRAPEQAALEFQEMEESAAAERRGAGASEARPRESLWRRKYIVPFALACVILACNQATGVNSIIGYSATILIQAGLSDYQAHLGYVVLTVVNFLFTMVSVLLVDRKGRKFLLVLGSAGVIVMLAGAAVLFRQSERQRVDVRPAAQALVVDGRRAEVRFTPALVDRWLAEAGAAGRALRGKPVTLIVIYSCGDFRAASSVVRSDDPAARLLIARESCLPDGRVAAFFRNPFANLAAARAAPLRIDHALVTPVPGVGHGWLTALFIFGFMAFFSVGPGVCVWLALSELMPTRIRSNGMSVALLINQAVSTGIAVVFLPTVGQYGYSAMFALFAGCTVVYFAAVFFFLPETKGRTLEEIEAYFERRDQ